MRTFENTYFCGAECVLFTCTQQNALTVVFVSNLRNNVKRPIVWSVVRCQTYQHHPTSNFSKSLFVDFYVLFKMRTFQSTYFSYPINRKTSKSTHFSVGTAYTVSVVSFENQSESVSSVTFWSGVRCQTYQHHPTSNFSKSLFVDFYVLFKMRTFQSTYFSYPINRKKSEITHFSVATPFNLCLYIDWKTK